jgi:hypothetical protein
VAIFVAAVSGFAAFLYVLSFRPGLLGPNVEVARQLFGAALLVPAFRSLTEFHIELCFAYRRFGTELMIAILLVVIKAVALVALVTGSSDPSVWGLWLNAIGAGLYLSSATAVYLTLHSMQRQQEFMAP